MKKLLLLLLLVLAPNATCRAGVSVVGDLLQRSTAAAGDRYEGSITVRNNGVRPTQVRIAKRDYLFFASGRNDYAPPGSHPRSNANWLTVNPAQLTVPPATTASFHYVVQVPKDAAPPLSGSYWSVLIVEPIEADEDAPAGGQKGAVALRTLVRYAVQLVTDLGEAGERKIRFLDQQLLVDQGKRWLQLDIENVGERWLSPQVWVDLYDAGGEPAGHFESGQQRIYPGCSVRHRVDLTGVPAGRYTALAIVDNKDDHVFGGQYDLVIK